MEAIKKWFKRLKLQKMHLDYIAGILTIPVLATAIVLNWSSLHKTNASPSPSPSMSSQSKPEVVVVSPTAPQISPSGECQKKVGPIEISAPQEGQTVTDNPVCITISYPDNSYCSVVWSYKINGGPWSDYNSNSPCLYNVPNGKVDFQLRVQSTASQDTKSLERAFNYQGANTSPSPSPTPSQTTEATSSAKM